MLSPLEQQCGVYQYGKNVAASLGRARRYDFETVECADLRDLQKAVRRTKPVAIIYNYHPSTLSWLTSDVTGRFKVPQIGTIHECSQASVDAATNALFDAHVAPDPTLLLRNPLVFKTGRPLQHYTNPHPTPEVPTIGSFGFGLKGKGFDRVIEAVQREFDQAEIRLHIPFSPILDPSGEQAADIRQQCEQLIVKPNIKLSLSHDFLDQEQMLDFLARNTINAFFYDRYPGRGISSATDYALAVRRPIALSRSEMFRHFRSAYPSVFIEDSSLRELIDQGIKPLEPFYREWSQDNLAWDYERVVSKLLASPFTPPLRRPHPLLTKARPLWQQLRRGVSTIALAPLRAKVRPLWHRFWDQRLIPAPSPSVDWVREDTGECTEVKFGTKPIESYRAAIACNGSSLNRILDNDARNLYRPAIDELFRLVPEMLERKIPEANVQQAFVLDTVHRLITAEAIAEPRLLCVGSYEDSAAASLKRLGYHLDEIDPVINFGLGEFCSRPSTAKSSYDLVFSTSVIEHVADDEKFLLDIASLLAPGGKAVLTCDYRDQYQPGDPKPVPDFRLYTQRDFRERLLPLLPDCELIDEPQWTCPEPDFHYEGCQYTFATLVFRKRDLVSAAIC